MGRESEPGRFKGRGRYWGRGWGRSIRYLKKRSSSSLYNREEVKFMTRSRKQAYTYTEVKGVIIQRLQKSYGYEVASSLRDI